MDWIIEILPTGDGTFYARMVSPGNREIVGRSASADLPTSESLELYLKFHQGLTPAPAARVRQEKDGKWFWELVVAGSQAKLFYSQGLYEKEDAVRVAAKATSLFPTMAIVATAD